METVYLTEELAGSPSENPSENPAENSVEAKGSFTNTQAVALGDQQVDSEDELILRSITQPVVEGPTPASEGSTAGNTAFLESKVSKAIIQTDLGTSLETNSETGTTSQIQAFQYVINDSLQLKNIKVQNRQRVVQIPLLVKGSYNLPNKGPWVVNDFLLERIEINFKNNVLGFAPPLYKGHDHLYSLEEPPAHGFMFDCFREGDVLYSLFEVVNANTYEEINLGYYRHASVEYLTYAQDRRTGEEVGALLTAVALTNSPFIVDMPTNKILNKLQTSLDRSDLGCIRSSRNVVLSLKPAQLVVPALHSDQQSNQMDETLKELETLKKEAERLRLEAERARSEAAAAKQTLSQIHRSNLQRTINSLSLSAELKEKAFNLVTTEGLTEAFQNSFVALLAEVLASANELQKRTSQYGMNDLSILEPEMPRPYQQIIQRNRQGKKSNAKHQEV